MLNYNEILPKKFVELDGEPYEVLASHVFRKQQRKPVNQTKLKNLITGKVVERSFHQSEKVNEADLVKKPVKYLYSSKGEYWFCDNDNPRNRFTIPSDTLGSQMQFIPANYVVDSLLFGERVIGMVAPVKMDLKVKEAPPAVKGDTAQGAVKQIVLETGATINAPLFINEGDVVRINTETGQYTERVNK